MTEETVGAPVEGEGRRVSHGLRREKGDLLVEGRIWQGRWGGQHAKGEKGELGHGCRRGFGGRETEETFRWHSMREEKVTRREKRLGEQGNVKQARKCAEERPFVEGKNNVDKIEVHSQRRDGEERDDRFSRGENKQSGGECVVIHREGKSA